jgi:hypothetical protein
MKTKKCSQCGRRKSVEEFYKHNRTPDGFSKKCVECYARKKGRSRVSEREYQHGLGRHPSKWRQPFVPPPKVTQKELDEELKQRALDVAKDPWFVPDNFTDEEKRKISKWGIDVTGIEKMRPRGDPREPCYVDKKFWKNENLARKRVQQKIKKFGLLHVEGQGWQPEDYLEDRCKRETDDD